MRYKTKAEWAQAMADGAERRMEYLQKVETRPGLERRNNREAYANASRERERFLRMAASYRRKGV